MLALLEVPALYSDHYRQHRQATSSHKHHFSSMYTYCNISLYDIIDSGLTTQPYSDIDGLVRETIQVILCEQSGQQLTNQ